MKIKDLLKTEDIITTTPDETLSAVLGQLGSSHDAAFVFDKEEKFLGVINPYYSIIKSSYPANAKVKTCIMHPPKIQLSSSLEEAARLMIESKIHYLPVFDDKKFVGIVSARRVLRHVLDSSKLQRKLGQEVSDKKALITIAENDPISKAMTLFKKYKISKLVVTDDKDKLKGILSYYDIIEHLTTPRERQNYASMQGDKDSVMKKAVKNFSQVRVVTLQQNNTLQDAAEKILDKQIGSIIVTGHGRVPIGIITTRDILTMFVPQGPVPVLQVSMKGLSDAGSQAVESVSKSLNNLLKKEKTVKKARMSVKGKKQGGLVQAVVSIFTKGRKLVVKEEGKDLKRVLQDVKKKSKSAVKREK